MIVAYMILVCVGINFSTPVYVYVNKGYSSAGNARKGLDRSHRKLKLHSKEEFIWEKDWICYQLRRLLNMVFL